MQRVSPPGYSDEPQSAASARLFAADPHRAQPGLIAEIAPETCRAARAATLVRHHPVTFLRHPAGPVDLAVLVPDRHHLVDRDTFDAATAGAAALVAYVAPHGLLPPEGWRVYTRPGWRIVKICVLAGRAGRPAVA